MLWDRAHHFCYKAVPWARSYFLFSVMTANRDDTDWTWGKRRRTLMTGWESFDPCVWKKWWEEFNQISLFLQTITTVFSSAPPLPLEVFYIPRQLCKVEGNMRISATEKRRKEHDNTVYWIKKPPFLEKQLHKEVFFCFCLYQTFLTFNLNF